MTFDLSKIPAEEFAEKALGVPVHLGQPGPLVGEVVATRVDEDGNVFADLKIEDPELAAALGMPGPGEVTTKIKGGPLVQLKPEHEENSMRRDWKCRCCDCTATTVRWRRFSNRTLHIEEECADCGAFTQWAPQTEEYVERVGPKPGQNESEKGD